MGKPEPETGQANSRELLRRCQTRQSDAATAIFDLYVRRLINLARARIGARLRRRIDPEDVVQSAYRSFFRRAENDEYVLQRSGDLWRLLAQITLHKLYGQIERHTAARRHIGREQEADSNVLTARLAAASGPTPDESAAMIEQVERALAMLKPLEREVLVARLRGETIESISQNIQRSERTVRRLLEQSQRVIENMLWIVPEDDLRYASTTADIDPRAPLRYSDYLLEKLLGAGGMGKVYEATQRSLGRRVAVKSLLKSRQADPRAVEQFLREGQVLASLRHPNIVGFHGLGRFPGGGYFLVMDLIEGRDLQSLLGGGPLPVDRAVQIVRTVAAAVGHVHHHGVIHCDLKPANILLDKSGQPVVTDFGLAQLVKREAIVIGGTSGYMAPELVEERIRLSPAVDVYGLGALLFALLTGMPPGPAELCLPSQRRNDIPPPLDLVCRRSLCRDPAKRLQNVQEFTAALDDCVD
jgi:DNA-directed RNA polymerase specialized sigma24 family protein